MSEQTCICQPPMPYAPGPGVRFTCTHGWVWEAERMPGDDLIDQAIARELDRALSDDQTERLTGKPTPGQIAFGLRREGDR